MRVLVFVLARHQFVIGTAQISHIFNRYCGARAVAVADIQGIALRALVAVQMLAEGVVAGYREILIGG